MSWSDFYDEVLTLLCFVPQTFGLDLVVKQKWSLALPKYEQYFSRNNHSAKMACK
jgi:hypothetical protein